MKAVSITIVLILALAGCSARFAELSSTRQLAASRNADGFGVTFFGTSTLLIDDGETQILIDGFMTRVRHRFVRKIKPSEDQILAALVEHGICPDPKYGVRVRRSGICAAQRARGLSIIIPAHAHYDHALDSAYIAGWAGTRLVADPSIRATYKATRALEWTAPMNWRDVRLIRPFKSRTQNIRHLDAGDFRITLVRSEHLKNPLSSLAASTTNADLKLPAHLWEFGEGTNLSIRIEKNGRSILVVPTAGVFTEQMAARSLESDVIFMGIGGLGWKPVDERKHFWRTLVDVTGAKRVIPIHWDDDQVRIKSGEANFALASPRRFDATLKVFEKLAARDEIEITFAPAETRFDPFRGLPPRPRQF